MTLAGPYGTFASRAPGHAVPSPCVSVCQIDVPSGLCRGCLRTLDEIAGWSGATSAQKLAILQQLPTRQLPPPPLDPSP